MKRLIFAALFCMAPLTACETLPTPAAVADSTIVDERAALSLELAYKAARIAVETSVDAGLIKGPTAELFDVRNDRAYAAVKAVRAAYQAGNSQDYLTMAAIARIAISDLLALTGKNR